MINQIFTPQFLHQVAAGNGTLLILVIVYDILSLALPVIKVSLGLAVLLFVLVNFFLVGLRALTVYFNQQS